MSDKSLNVRDRRMFTPDGELREEYRDLPPPPKAAPVPPAAATAPAKAHAAEKGAAAGVAPGAAPGVAPGAAPGAAPAENRKLPPVETATGANFEDLVGLLAQTASVYLQQASQGPFAERADHMEMARMHVDLLVILKQKTTGNLEPMELALVDDLLYRLRMAMVERG